MLRFFFLILCSIFVKESSILSRHTFINDEKKIGADRLTLRIRDDIRGES